MLHRREQTIHSGNYVFADVPCGDCTVGQSRRLCGDGDMLLSEEHLLWIDLLLFPRHLAFDIKGRHLSNAEFAMLTNTSLHGKRLHPTLCVRPRGGVVHSFVHQSCYCYFLLDCWCLLFVAACMASVQSGRCETSSDTQHLWLVLPCLLQV